MPKIDSFDKQKGELVLSKELTPSKLKNRLASGLIKAEEDFSFFSLVNQGRSKSDFLALLALAEKGQAVLKRPILVHLRAGDLRPEDVGSFVQEMLAKGLVNFLVVRGDFRLQEDGYQQAEALLSALQRESKGAFFLAGTIDPTAADLEEILERIKAKKAAGAALLISQIALDAEPLLALQNAMALSSAARLALSAGLIQQPTAKQLTFLKEKFGLKISADLLREPEKRAALVEKELFDGNFSAFHYFSLPD
ncbi:methylenetetrahydrofolate reductase [Fructobacillus sp. M158]|uniref:methylenetetrahydrofolate reductase n=1 Tax=Fructobacillus parabroussonetiae TaxID=2713174 RepID=UPI00200B3CCE|nr:methylenetetrahydrofolate reductase [Fructobacillus parabroussonetiae]MCK8617367.1 methylenetetrahydrofolate reductase [Fructobacillus parabroussonetiae]